MEYKTTQRRAAAPPVRFPLRRPAARAGGSPGRGDREASCRVVVVVMARRRAARPPATGRGEVEAVPGAGAVELGGARRQQA